MKEQCYSKTSQVIDSVDGSIIALKLWDFEVPRECGAGMILMSKGGSLLNSSLSIEERLHITSIVDPAP